MSVMDQPIEEEVPRRLSYEPPPLTQRPVQDLGPWQLVYCDEFEEVSVRVLEEDGRRRHPAVHDRLAHTPLDRSGGWMKGLDPALA